MDAAAAARELRRLIEARNRAELTGSAYRQRRAAILDRLVGMKPLVDVDVTRPRGGEARPSPASPPAPTTAAPSSPVPAARRHGRLPWLAASIGVSAVALAAAYWFWIRPMTGSPAASAGLPAISATDAGADGGVRVLPLDEFLRRNDWSDASIAALNASWWGLSDEEIIATLNSDGARRLTTEIEARLHGRGTTAGPPPLEIDAPLILLARNLNVAVPPEAIGTARSAQNVAPAPAARVATRTTTPAVSAAPTAPPPSTASARKPADGAPPREAAAAPAAATAVAAATGAAQDPCAEYFANPRHRTCRDTLAGGRPGPELVVIPRGQFRMGSSATPAEQPVHDVTMARTFAMMATEASVGDYRAFCAATGRPPPAGAPTSDALPAVNVSWSDARDYARWLSESTGFRYRLPSEAEWEYAARANRSGEPGKELPAPSPATEARYAAPGIDRPSGPVAVDDATFKANDFRLRHMLGNVREWTQDLWSADYRQAPSDGGSVDGASGPRVVRGGSFRDGLDKVRPAAREPLDPSSKDLTTGFRLVREIRAVAR